MFVFGSESLAHFQREIITWAVVVAIVAHAKNKNIKYESF